MTSHRITESVNLVILRCTQCGGVPFAMTESLDQKCRIDGQTFYCPMGHSMSWRNQTENDKLRRERDVARQQIARAMQETAEAEDRARRAEAAQRRLAKRINAGLCPCCNRSFQNVARHMATKHKGVALLKAERASA